MLANTEIINAIMYSPMRFTSSLLAGKSRQLFYYSLFVWSVQVFPYNDGSKTFKIRNVVRRKLLPENLFPAGAFVCVAV